MSWWEDQMGGLADSPMFLGAAAAAVTAFIRTYRHHPGMRFAVRVCEAMTCSLISTMLTYALVLYFHLSYETAIPTGIFVGFLGTDTMVVYLTRLLDRVIPHNKKSDKAAEQE